MSSRSAHLSLILVVSLSACGTTRPSDSPAERPLRFTTPTVLFVSPDEAELAQLREALGEDFYTVTDDAMWYRSEAYELLERSGIPYEHVGRESALFQVRGELQKFSWAEEDRPWFIVYYDGVREPRILYDIELPGAIEARPEGRRPQGGGA